MGQAKSIEPESGPILTSNIYQLITLLGSDDWQTREKAQKQLEDWPQEKLAEIEPALKEAAQSNDPEVRMRANQILKLIAVKKRVKFSDSFLKEFPAIYRDLARRDAHGKMEFLCQITTPDEEGDYKYKDTATRTDIAGLIGEALLEPEGLVQEDKLFLLSLSKGKNWESLFESV